MSVGTKSRAFVDFIARLFVASLFLYAGIGKILDYHGTAAYMAAYGVPTDLLPIVIAVELLGSICLILGLLTRPAATILALFSLAAIVIFHHVLDSQAAVIVTLAELGLTGGLMQIAIHGPGCISIDHHHRRRT